MKGSSTKVYINERVGGRSEEREGVLGNRALAGLPSTEISPILLPKALFRPRPFDAELPYENLAI